ncbi:MAG: hypothetical protein ISS35_04610 [Kiritimatiellae bacterium]|nr:hypothetical protein [Kiritimatiellia bacterium]
MSIIGNPKSRIRNSLWGFTIVEVLVASTLSILVIFGTVMLFITHIKDYRDQKLVREMQQNVRFAVDAVCRDLRMAGYGLNIRKLEMDNWLSWEANFTANPLVLDGAGTNGTDKISIAAAFDSDPAYTANAVSSGVTTITVKNGKGFKFEKNQHRLIFIGRLETARVISRAGDSLTISTHPTLSGHGLRYGYAANSPVERVDITEYSCTMGAGPLAGIPCLERSDSEPGIFSSILGGPTVAAYIEDLQFTSDGYAFELSISGRTSERMSRPGTGDDDGYRRMTVTTRITPRNAAGVVLRN